MNDLGAVVPEAQIGQKNRALCLGACKADLGAVSATSLLIGPCPGLVSLAVRQHLHCLTHMHGQVLTGPTAVALPFPASVFSSVKCHDNLSPTSPPLVGVC